MIVATGATLVVGLIGLLALPALAPERAEAHGTYVPYHQIGNWFYDNYGLGVYPPRIMRPSKAVSCYDAQEVRWSPDLYRWNGSSWVLYNRSAPWYAALTSSGGYCYMQAFYGYWWNTVTYRTLLFHRFGSLPRGYYYAIKNYMYWRSLGRTHVQWSDVFRTYSASSTGSRTGAAIRAKGSQPPAPTRANSDGARKALPSS